MSEETPGVVTRIEHGMACVEIGPRAVGCGRCHEPGGCAAGVVGGGDRPRRRTYRLPNVVGADVGDQVLLVMRDGALLRVSLLAYLLPALLVIVGAGLGNASSDAGAIIGALLGLAAGMGVLRLVQAGILASREPLLSMRIQSCDFPLHKDPPAC